MADPIALDIDAMLRGEYGARPAGATPTIAEQPVYRTPQTFEELAAEIYAGGPVPVDAPARPRPAGGSPRPAARVQTARDVAPGAFRDRTFEERAQEQAAAISPATEEFRAAASAQQANALAREFGIPVEEAIQLLGARVSVPGRDNQMRPIVEEARREGLGGPEIDPATGQPIPGTFEPGYLERQRGAIAAEGDATIARDRELSAELARQGLRNELEMAVAEDKERLAAERMQDQLARVKEGNDAVAKAQQTLRAQPDVDPERFWNSRTAGQKALFVIGGLLSRGIFGGAFGRFADLQGAIEDDIDAQETNINKRVEELRGIGTAAAAQHNTLADLVAVTGDLRSAREGTRLAMLEAQKQQYLAKAMELGIPVTEAHVQQTLAEFDEAISKSKLQFDTMVATTPPRIGGGSRPAIQDKDVRALVLARGKQGIESQADFAKLGVTEQGASDRELGKARIEAEGKAGEAAMKLLRGEGGIYREAAGLADKIAEKQGIVTQLKDLKREFAGGIPGVGPFAATESIVEWGKGVAGGENRAHAFRKKVENVVDRVLRERTGAVAAPEEVKQYTDFIMEGSEDIGGEKKVMQNLDALIQSYEPDVDVMMRGRSPEAQEYIQQNTLTPQRDPENFGRPPQREVVRPK